jgi:phosphatidylserine/phosphatidylglycerophosphate/cardiolipin synthase-like enzyme
MGYIMLKTMMLVLLFSVCSFAEVVSVHFNHDESHFYTDPYRNIRRRGEDLEKELITQVNSAEKEVLVAVQQLQLPNLAQAMVDAKKRGVKVLVVLENTYNYAFKPLTRRELLKLPKESQRRYLENLALIDVNHNSRVTKEELLQRDAITMLRAARIPIVDDTFDGSLGSALMHHKFIVADRKRVTVTSANFTLSGVHGDLFNSKSRGNANALIHFALPELAQIFAKEFFTMFGNGIKGSGKSRFGIQKPFRGAFRLNKQEIKVAGQFAATPRSAPWKVSTNAFIGNQLSRAQRSIYISMFAFSEQRLVDILERRHNKGLKMGVLIDPSFIARSWSEGLDMWGLEKKDAETCLYENGNRPWANPLKYVGTPKLAYGDKLHHKFAIIDNSKVIFGSQNWSESGAHQNDENVLIISNRKVVAGFMKEFKRLSKSTRFGPTEKVISQIRQRERLCSAKRR